MDGRNLRCSTTGSCQSTVTSKIVKRAGHSDLLCK